MTQCTYGNGLQDTRSYDLQGRLLSQQLEDTLQQANSVLAEIPDRQMVYNNAGRLYQLIENDTLKAECC